MTPEATAIRELVDRHRRVLVLSHKDPDGDTLGSALAMRLVLEEMGKQVVNRVPPPVADMYTFLPGYETLNAPAGGWEPELVLVMDASNLERLAGVMAGVPEGTPIVNIDHHVSNTRFGDVNLVVPTACSTAEVTYDLLRDWGVVPTAGVAANLYAGVLTDTGSFRHENTTHRALTIAADLVLLGADAAAIAEAVYKRRKLSTLKLQALVMAGIRFECDDRLVYACATLEDLRRAGAAADETEGLIDMLNSVDGLEVALLFKEIDGGLTKVSVRTRGQISANEVAAAFGGGGHARAAGAELRLPIAEAVPAFLAEARGYLTPPA
ncbi:MAG TPA: DHH family phosphoesterase [Candidatus Dormibacteraeota bacterium]|jgi:phosphoesterase RecJ-like protein|nr:DHH family phosphoesterase [Candidatus Dormibacteraeota bacterium]